MLGDAIASKNVASCNLQQSGVEDDLGNEEEMVKGGGGPHCTGAPEWEATILSSLQPVSSSD